jgi:hypothetical protein
LVSVDRKAGEDLAGSEAKAASVKSVGKSLPVEVAGDNSADAVTKDAKTIGETSGVESAGQEQLVFGGDSGPGLSWLRRLRFDLLCC